MGIISRQRKNLAPNAPTPAPQRKHKVVRDLKLELVSALLANDESARARDPYDSSIGRGPRDLWGQSRRA
jgi:hypothetical protein